MSNQLTAEQQRKIEENRRKALERRALRLAQTNPGDGQASLLSSKGASERVHPSNSISHQRATPNAAAAAPKQFVAPVKQHESRLHDTTGNNISHHTNSAPNEVSFSAFVREAKWIWCFLNPHIVIPFKLWQISPDQESTWQQQLFLHWSRRSDTGSHQTRPDQWCGWLILQTAQ